ncbi:MAG: hypothetical protein ACKVQB_10420 [Bacteroidia bacterium]
MKYFLCTIIGLLTGLVCISLFEYLSIYLFPLPSGLDMQDMNSIAENMDSIPLVNFILVLVSYALASFIAGFVSVKIRTPKPQLPVITIAILLTAFGFVNFLTIPHPLWMIIAGSVTFIPMVWLGGKAGLNRRDYQVYGF